MSPIGTIFRWIGRAAISIVLAAIIAEALAMLIRLACWVGSFHFGANLHAWGLQHFKLWGYEVGMGNQVLIGLSFFSCLYGWIRLDRRTRKAIALKKAKAESGPTQSK